MPARSSRQERARGAPATAADAGELVEARGDIGAFRRPRADRPVLRRFVPDMQDLFAQLERQLGEGDVQGSAATLHTIKGSASTVGASALAGRASELEQVPALRRSAARYGNPRRHPPRRTAHPVRCLPAPPAGDVRRRAGGVGELNPGVVACPAKDSGGPGARLHPLRRITPWALSADTPEARPGLRATSFLSFSSSQGVAQQVVGAEWRRRLPAASSSAAADGVRESPGGSCGRAPLLLEAHADAAHAAHLAEGRGDPQADAQLFLHAPQQVFQSSSCAGLPVSGQALLFLAGQRRCDGPRRAPPGARVRRRRRRAGRAGGGAEALMATS